MSKKTEVITPLMFIRTNHAWYWTPEVGNEYIGHNWLIIYPGGSLKVIGGYWDDLYELNHLKQYLRIFLFYIVSYM